MKIKAGLGYDIHKLEQGRQLFLGGVEIPFALGLLGHSDGDCLIHALIDAILGAMGENDIGQHFPDTDPNYKDIRSTALLKEVADKIKNEKLEIINIDSVIIAEEPKLTNHIYKMKETLSSILGIEKGNIGIKAKTNEGVDTIGQKKAIASWAIVLLQQK